MYAEIVEGILNKSKWGFWIGLFVISGMWFAIGYSVGHSPVDKQAIIEENCEDTTRPVEIIEDRDPRSVKVGQYRVATWNTEDPFKKDEMTVVEVLAIQDDHVKYKYQIGTDDQILLGNTNSTDLHSFARIYGTIMR